MSGVLRCVECADVIGVYEPLVMVEHSGVRLTSLAAEGPLAYRGEGQYHAACYANAQTRQAADEPRQRADELLDPSG